MPIFIEIKISSPKMKVLLKPTEIYYIFITYLKIDTQNRQNNSGVDPFVCNKSI